MIEILKNKRKLAKVLLRFYFRYFFPFILVTIFPVTAFNMGIILYYAVPYLLPVLPALSLSQCVLLAVPHACLMLILAVRDYFRDKRRYGSFKGMRRYLTDATEK